MKFLNNLNKLTAEQVALRGRAWIEIGLFHASSTLMKVALRGRAWIEIPLDRGGFLCYNVALRGRAWIEISRFIISCTC